MDLKDFVVSAISDIANAVKEADTEIQAIGGLVNPGTHAQSAAFGGQPQSREAKTRRQEERFVAPRTTLQFDIAISAAKTGETAAGAKAKIWVVEASLGGKGETTNETVSRLTFSLDVVLPHDAKQFERIGMVKTAKTA